GHAPLGLQRARLDLLGKLDLLGLGQQLAAADLAQVGSERVVGVDEVGRDRRGRAFLAVGIFKPCGRHRLELHRLDFYPLREVGKRRNWWDTAPAITSWAPLAAIARPR